MNLIKCIYQHYLYSKSNNVLHTLVNVCLENDMNGIIEMVYEGMEGSLMKY